jgi:hypothetical protein
LSTKFENAKQNYEISRQKLNRPVFIRPKTARMLTSCPSALKLLLSKSNLANNVENTESGDLFNSGEQRVQSASSVAFTANFVKYYFGIFNIFKAF